VDQVQSLVVFHNLQMTWEN